jgi:hypothetical protein
MSYPVFYERMTSRPFDVSRESSTFTAEFLAVGSTNETDVYEAALLSTPISYLGLYRAKVKAVPRGGPYWDVSVEYTSIQPKDALSSDTAANDQKPSPSDDEPLTGGTTHITQSIDTVSQTVRVPLVAPDFRNAIGVTLEGVEGCDIITPNAEFSSEAKRVTVTMKYFRTLRDLTGTVNSEKWFGFERGEVLYLGCEGKADSKSYWTLTHRFAVSKNQTNIKISSEITVPAKEGWQYLWVDYTGDFSQGRRVRRPTCATVEQVYYYRNFGALEIGT